MLFNSFEFAVFLAVVFLLYWFVFNREVRTRNIFIIAVSYIFYGWWDWRFLILIAFTSLCSYASGIAISKSWQRESRKAARWYTGANIAVNLLILCTFKYYNFFASEFAARFLDGDASGILVKLILPVGISFYTFQALSYSIDVYRRKLEATRDVTAFFAYIAFFPQLVAGPIERATNLLPQFYRLHSFSREDGVDGARRIIWGLFKKIIVADSCAMVLNPVFANYQDLPASSLAIAAVLFAFQVYGDFSGYSDIAIGTAKLFGYNLMDNFRYPYFSRDIGEFWRRWHISLNTWFRDYVYIPLGGSRVGKHKVVRNTFAIFLLSGLWHGANWTFITWGGYHATLFVPLILTKRNRRHTDIPGEGRRLPSWMEARGMVVTFFLVVLGLVIFRSATISDAWHYICDMFSRTIISRPEGLGGRMSDLWFACGSIVVMLVVEWLQRARSHGLDIGHIRSQWVRWLIYYIVIATFFLGKGSQTFIYFQF